MCCEPFVEVAMATKDLVERKVRYILLKFSSKVCRLHKLLPN
ncbi:hypothetical protein ABIE61_002961 [Marinobacterium sp. MBR-111]|jgi:hypothetical protein